MTVENLARNPQEARTSADAHTVERNAVEGFEYSDILKAMLVHKHRGMENWPNYQEYIRDGLAGPNSRVVNFTKQLFPEIKRHCGDIAGMRALDFGCGTGSTTVPMALSCRDVVAFDIDEESIEIAKQRIKEHDLEKSVRFCFANDIGEVKEALGTFDFILVNGVIEHIPLTMTGERKRIVRLLFGMLNRPGYLYINETPNRLWPFDFHSTQLWWIPWMMPGSERAYRKAMKKGRYSDAPTISKGPLGLEEIGAWGATYWEIRSYLKDERFECLNLEKGHNRHIQYCSDRSTKRIMFDSAVYFFAVKLLRVPIVAFAPFIKNLIIKKD